MQNFYTEKTKTNVEIQIPVHNSKYFVQVIFTKLFPLK